VRQLIAAGFAVVALLATAVDAAASATTVTTATWRTMPVPLYHQKYGLDCEATALQMALAYQGIVASQDALLNAIGIDWRMPVTNSTGFHWGDPYANFVGNPNGSEAGLTGYGTYYSTIARVAQQYGATVMQSGEGISPQTIYQDVLGGHPVIAWVSFDWRWHQVSHYTAFDGRYVQFGEPYEHTVTIIGVTDTTLLINNPWFGRQWIPKATFEPAYATFNHMAVILAGPTTPPLASTTVSTNGPLAPANPYHPLAPARVFDSRVTGPRLGPGGSTAVQVAGQQGVPPTGATAAVLNVTVTNTTAASYLTVYPSGAPQPLASNLNWRAGQTRANLVEVSLGPDGKIVLYNSAGSTDVVLDVEGWVGPATTAGAGLYNPVTPTRILDTRNGTGVARAGALSGGQSITLQITGQGGVPSAGVSAVVLNVTVTGTSTAGFLTVYPTGGTVPQASNVNWAAGATVPNRVIVSLSAAGQATFYNGPGGAAQVIADVGGWFTDATGTAGSQFIATTPQRLLDTRNGFGAVPPGGRAVVQVSESSLSHISAVVLNVTATGPGAASFLTLWPDGVPQPLASDLNFVPGETVPNLVVVKVSASGGFDLYNSAGLVDVVIDLAGYYA
jgi:uncharacterized protein YvpB